MKRFAANQSATAYMFHLCPFPTQLELLLVNNEYYSFSIKSLVPASHRTCLLWLVYYCRRSIKLNKHVNNPIFKQDFV